MRSHIADGTDAPIRPTPPVERMVDGVIVHMRSDPEKEIPGELVWNRIIARKSRG